jgi:hypothetical protein
MAYLYAYPKNTEGEPCADTDPHEIASPILTAALPLIKTVEDASDATPS